MTFHPCESLDEVLDVALVGGIAALEGRATPGGTTGPATKRRSNRRKDDGDTARA
jgi:ATP-dependent Lon protease